MRGRLDRVMDLLSARATGEAAPRPPRRGGGARARGRWDRVRELLSARATSDAPPRRPRERWTTRVAVLLLAGFVGPAFGRAPAPAAPPQTPRATPPSRPT